MKCEGFERPCNEVATRKYEGLDFCDDCYRRLTLEGVELAYVNLDYPTMTDPRMLEGQHDFLDRMSDEPGVLGVDMNDLAGTTYIRFKFDAEDVKNSVGFAVRLEKLLGKKIHLKTHYDN
jgi:hypothetical protein